MEASAGFQKAIPHYLLYPKPYTLYYYCMTRDEIREVAAIVGGDRTYQHFVRRINKEFEISDEERNSNVYVLTHKEGDKKVGFCVIGHSPNKMKVWNKEFKEEGWVDSSFCMDTSPLELMYIYVKPEYRGKGIGTELFRNVIDFAYKKEVKQIYAYVSDRSPKALFFYKKMKAEIIQDFSDEETSAAFLRWSLGSNQKII